MALRLTLPELKAWHLRNRRTKLERKLKQGMPRPERVRIQREITSLREQIAAHIDEAQACLTGRIYQIVKGRIVKGR